ncbi:MAG: hypothetical protein ABW167_22570 [Baekduia sp.]
MILGAVQVVVNVADLAAAEAPLTAAGFTRSFHEPRLASHPAKDIMVSGPRDALAMVHLTPPTLPHTSVEGRLNPRGRGSVVPRRLQPALAIELTAYAGGAPAGAAAFTMSTSGEVTSPTDDRAASGAFWDALNAPQDDDGLRRFGAALPAWRLTITTVDGPSRAGTTTVDANGCVLVSLVTSNVDAELARLHRGGVLRRATEAWDEDVAGRTLRVAIVEGPAGELAELLQIPSAP